VFEAIVYDLRLVLRVCHGKRSWPTAAIIDSRTIKSTPESGSRSGYDGYKHTQGSKVHKVVDTLGHLLALHVTPANESERDQVELLAKQVQDATGERVTMLYADGGYTGRVAAADAAIVGWSQLLLNGERHDEDFTEGLKIIDRNARAQTRIVDDLLDMSRIINGKVRLYVQPVDLAALAAGAAKRQDLCRRLDLSP